MLAQQTFNCPHCGAVYPFKEVLVDRAVRCTACKKPFCLQASGEAIPVLQGPATARHTRPSGASTAAGVTSPPIPAKQSSGEHAPTPDRQSSGAYKPHTEAISRRTSSSSRMTIAYERKRQAMSTNLSQAATQALTQVVKKDGVRPRTERIGGASAGLGGTAERTKSSKEISPPVLTGEGDRPRLLPWWVLSSVLGCATVIALWIFWPQSPQSRVITEFGSGKAVFLAGGGVERLSSRAEIIVPGAEVQAISRLSQHRLGSVEQHSLQPVTDIIGNLRPLGHWSLWIDQAHRDQGLSAIRHAESAVAAWRLKVERLTAVIDGADTEEDPWASAWADAPLEVELPPPPPSPREHFDTQAAEHGWELRAEPELRQAISEIPRSGPLLRELFSSSDGPLREYAAEGTLPRKVEIQHFTGQGGLWAMGFGDPVEVAYAGQLLRFVGRGVDARWRLWKLEAR